MPSPTTIPQSLGKLAICGMAVIGCFLAPGALKGWVAKWRGEENKEERVRE